MLLVLYKHFWNCWQEKLISRPFSWMKQEYIIVWWKKFWIYFTIHTMTTRVLLVVKNYYQWHLFPNDLVMQMHFCLWENNTFSNIQKRVHTRFKWKPFCKLTGSLLCNTNEVGGMHKETTQLFFWIMWTTSLSYR